MKGLKTSRVGKFYEKSLEERLELIKEFASLSKEEVGLLKKEGALGFDTANKMIENVVGSIELPIGIATNFVINGKPRLIPMAIEEPSVIAAASNAAKLTEGFETSASESIMMGQIQIVGVKDFEKGEGEVGKNKE